MKKSKRMVKEFLVAEKEFKKRLLIMTKEDKKDELQLLQGVLDSNIPKATKPKPKVGNRAGNEVVCTKSVVGVSERVDHKLVFGNKNDIPKDTFNYLSSSCFKK